MSAFLVVDAAMRPPSLRLPATCLETGHALFPSRKGPCPARRHLLQTCNAGLTGPLVLTSEQYQHCLKEECTHVWQRVFTYYTSSKRMALYGRLGVTLVKGGVANSYKNAAKLTAALMLVWKSLCKEIKQSRDVFHTLWNSSRHSI